MNQEDKEFTRNRPAEEGRRNDPDTREESAQQPGVNTYSNSDTDAANQQLTKTAADNFEPGKFGEDADPAFDEVNENKDED